jgi:ribosomal protein S12 methylthiotransferase accessory factor
MNFVFDLPDAYLRETYPVTRLLMPTGAILAGVTRMAGEHTAPDFQIAVSNLDNMTKIFPHIGKPDGRDVFDEPMGGAGADVNPELAWLRATMEGAERYANMAYTDDDFIVATANELGSSAIDLDRIARCSDREYADPKCPFVPPDRNAPMRWSRGYSLTLGRERFVPAVMTHLYLRPTSQERIWQEISTGVAAHTRLEAALISAICEVIERDAIAITWLARLQLPRIEFTTPLPAALATNFELLKRSLVQQYFFDATTDIGIPTVYAVQILEGHPTSAQYVNCATGFSAAEACAKTIREAAPARAVLKHVDGVPANVADFRSLYDGAHLLGRQAYRREFDFLLDSPRRRNLEAMEIDGPADERGRLRFLLDRLHGLGFEPVVIDLTTDELRELGIWVVRAVIPGLMPMSSVQRGRFLGTPRLYEYPCRAGFGALGEHEINPTPQPFA